jgi:starvation-inducible DNA-binding protein
MMQGRLVGLVDLALTLKHIHWNVVGPDFISVHTMLDRSTRA